MSNDLWTLFWENRDITCDFKNNSHHQRVHAVPVSQVNSFREVCNIYIYIYIYIYISISIIIFINIIIYIYTHTTYILIIRGCMLCLFRKLILFERFVLYIYIYIYIIYIYIYTYNIYSHHQRVHAVPVSQVNSFREVCIIYIYIYIL